WLGVVVVAALLIAPSIIRGVGFDGDRMKWTIGGLMAASLFASRWPLRFAATVAFAFLVARTYGADLHLVTSVRSFFGVVRVADVGSGQYRLMIHGTTPHGAERIRDDKGAPITGRPTPLSYYHETSPIGE